MRAFIFVLFAILLYSLMLDVAHTYTCMYYASMDIYVCMANVIRLSLGKLLVNLLQVVKRTNTPLIP